jgi:hypothetical protein
VAWAGDDIDAQGALEKVINESKSISYRSGSSECAWVSADSHEPGTSGLRNSESLGAIDEASQKRIAGVMQW